MGEKLYDQKLIPFGGIWQTQSSLIKTAHLMVHVGFCSYFRALLGQCQWGNAQIYSNSVWLQCSVESKSWGRLFLEMGSPPDTLMLSENILICPAPLFSPRWPWCYRLRSLQVECQTSPQEAAHCVGSPHPLSESQQHNQKLFYPSRDNTNSGISHQPMWVALFS